MNQWTRSVENLNIQHWARADWYFRLSDSETTLDLNLSRWSSTEIPPDMWEHVWQLPNLRHLSIASHLLTSLPPHIAHLTKLQSLNMFCNFTTFPSVIRQLTNLRDLGISGEFSTFPLDITQLPNLQKLGIFGLFTELPAEIGRLTSLEGLLLDSDFINGAERYITLVC